MDLRFDIVVFNFRKLESFFSNFGRISGFDRARDRLTVVSASPPADEPLLVDAFEKQHELEVRYLVRPNRGLAELGRAEYFTGDVGGLDENLSHAYVFQMQDHYLDTDSWHSKWFLPAPRVRADAVPDDVVFDLDRMEELGRRHRLDGFFCDRQDPSWYRMRGATWVAPSGGNFIVRNDRIRDSRTQRGCRRLIRSCDDTYRWAVYAEAMWGLIFFPEGTRVWDLKRDELFESWKPERFYVPAARDFRRLRAFYSLPRPVREAVSRIRAATRPANRSGRSRSS